MALQPGGYTDRPEDDNTKNAHPAYNRGKARGILETLAIGGRDNQLFLISTSLITALEFFQSIASIRPLICPKGRAI